MFLYCMISTVLDPHEVLPKEWEQLQKHVDDVSSKYSLRYKSQIRPQRVGLASNWPQLKAAGGKGQPTKMAPIKALHEFIDCLQTNDLNQYTVP